MEIPLHLESLPLQVYDDVIASAAEKGTSILAIIPATKPCFYKLWSLMDQAEKQGIPYIILNPGQHYDDLLGHGLDEFHFREKIGVDLNIRGDLAQKSAELFLKVKALRDHLRTRHPKVTLYPYVNGDTLTAGLFPAAWMFAFGVKCFYGEAGLRGMAPSSFWKLDTTADTETFVSNQFSEEWKLLRNEPFPEQYDTYVGAAGAQIHFAPVALNKEHLVREGYPESSVFVSGNTVVDAIAVKRKQKPDHSVFELYPKLEKGEWLRVDIHRRGNLTERRFKSIIGTVTNLVEQGENVAFIELNATRRALEHFGLRKKLEDLSSRENFLFTPIWKEYGHVIEFLESDHCWSILTDSGSMQEEMNELGKPCMTARFNTDRPETVMYGNTNCLIPPISSDFMTKHVSSLRKDETLFNSMRSGKKLYGTNVAQHILKELQKQLQERPFHWSHEELGLWKEDRDNPEYL